MYDYCEPLPKDETFVFLVDEHRCVRLQENIRAMGKKYSFSVKVLEKISSIDQKARVRHLIYRTKGRVEDLDQSRLRSLLTDFTSISFIFEYSSDEECARAGERIEQLKELTGDRVNFIRPDRFDGSWKVSDLKIIDNSVCDSVRIKYIPRRVDGDVVLPAAVEEYFLTAQRIYWDHKLYHRSPSDGYFAIRHPLNSEWFFITATKTYKDASFDVGRVSLVTRFEEAEGLIEYQGRYLPSSDSVEAAVVFRDCRNVNSIVHTHASIKFTRNPQYRARVLVPSMPYGEAELGRMVVRALAEVRDGFIIMQEHGEVFVSQDDLSATDVVMGFLWSSAAARQGK